MWVDNPGWGVDDDQVSQRESDQEEEEEEVCVCETESERATALAFDERQEGRANG